MIIGVMIRTKPIGPESAVRDNSSNGTLQSDNRTVTTALLSRMLPPFDRRVLLSLFISSSQSTSVANRVRELEEVHLHHRQVPGVSVVRAWKPVSNNIA